MTIKYQQSAIECHKAQREHRDMLRNRMGDPSYAGLIKGIGDEDTLENALRMLRSN